MITKELKIDLNIAEGIWVNILKKIFEDNLEYVYTKGSTIKNWDTNVDYVPLLSDLDIHYHTKKGLNLNSNLQNPFLDAINYFTEYHSEFIKKRKNGIHIPRIQLININKLKEKIQFIPSNINSIKLLFGNYKPEEIPSNDRIKEVDASNLLLIEEYLESAPESVIDKTGSDLWVFLRNLCWKISPTPVRLLTQIKEHPYDCWSWNRTKIIKNLISSDFKDIAKHYQNYYQTGWQLFNDNFKDIYLYKKIIKEGYYVLKLTYDAFLNL